MEIISMPHHIGIMHKGNRRWAKQYHKADPKFFYDIVIHTLVQATLDCQQLAIKYEIKELTFSGCFTENMQRSNSMVFTQAILEIAKQITAKGISFLIVGDTTAPYFPEILRPYTQPSLTAANTFKVNFLVNYSWEWDILTAIKNAQSPSKRHLPIQKLLGTDAISPIDLALRWGDDPRFNGFLPIQTMHAPLYVLRPLWPEYKIDHLYEALEWYNAHHAIHSPLLQAP